MARHLTLACGQYDRTQALIDGSIKPEGLELNWLVLSPPEIWRRMLNHYEFEASEMALSSYLIGRTQGKPLVAIPVFPLRVFRHSYIFIHSKRGIGSPRDLEGRRVAQAEFQQTATVWARGILQHEYGVDLGKIKWVNWAKPRMEITISKPYQVEMVPSAKAAEEMLVRGEIDAMICTRTLPSFFDGSPDVKRLFEDYKQVELAYYRKTKIYPIMHTVVIREELWREHPWIAVSLCKAFKQAKEVAYPNLDPLSPNEITMAWYSDLIREEREALGQDPWSYGARKNRHVVETLMEYLCEQGLASRALKIEEIFAPNTLDL